MKKMGYKNEKIMFFSNPSLVLIFFNFISINKAYRMAANLQNSFRIKIDEKKKQNTNLKSAFELLIHIDI